VAFVHMFRMAVRSACREELRYSVAASSMKHDGDCMHGVAQVHVTEMAPNSNIFEAGLPVKVGCSTSEAYFSLHAAPHNVHCDSPGACGSLPAPTV